MSVFLKVSFILAIPQPVYDQVAVYAQRQQVSPERLISSRVGERFVNSAEPHTPLWRQRDELDRLIDGIIVKVDDRDC